LLNSLYVFDNPDGGRKLVFTFNLSGQNTSTIECSDIRGTSPPRLKARTVGISTAAGFLL
ncbi:MAG: hypothetical protein ACOYJH_04710, partial [Anaerovoracaceae bacterium]|jgi:hypothetical protein